MKELKDLINNIDKSKENEAYVAFEELMESLGLDSFNFNIPYGEDCLLKAYYLWRFLDTDSHVGGIGLFLNNEFVCLSIEQGRKDYPTYHWASDKSISDVIEYFMSFMSFNGFKKINMDENMDNGITVGYGSNLLTNKIQDKDTGQIVEVIKKYNDRSYKEVSLWSKIDVKFPDGTIKEKVNVCDFFVPYCLNE